MKALRFGVWFKALQRIDRVLIDLTIKVATIVRNPKLVKSILTLITKLEEVMESQRARTYKEIGLPLAHKISLIAQKLGNCSAKSWATDFSFARFLAMMYSTTLKHLPRDLSHA